MTNQDIAHLLRSMAAVYEVKDEDFFRARAYENAAASIEKAASDLRAIWQEGNLQELSGIGSSIENHLDELFKTGKVKHFQDETKDVPQGMFELLKIDGVGPKSAYKLASEFGIEDEGKAVDKLKEAAENNQVAKLEGFGEDSQEKILDSIKKQIKIKDRLLLPQAMNLAEEVIEYIKQSHDVVEVEVLGSLRRRASTVGDIDVAVATERAEKVMDYVLKFEGIKKVLSSGSKTTMFIHKSGRQIDIKTQEPDKWGSMLQHYTGSKNHNIHLRTIAKENGLSLSEHGIKRGEKLTKYDNEKDFYKALGMNYIPAELREDRGEIEAALKGNLPKLVQIDDIKGDLQVHSNYDLKSSHDVGSSSLVDLLKKAGELGYEYLGITDHNPKQSGLSKSERKEILQARNKHFDEEYSSYENSVKKTSVKLLKGLEVDIKPDGELALEDENLELLDYVVASVHSSFRQDKKEATKRVLNGLSHPKIKIFAHPTGRMLGKREGLDYDWNEIFEHCLKNKIWIEVNASPKRLDLADSLIGDAIEKGVKIVINTDAHDSSGLEFMKYGVWTARRGWAERKNVINTIGWKELKKLIY